MSEEEKDTQGGSAASVRADDDASEPTPSRTKANTKHNLSSKRREAATVRVRTGTLAEAKGSEGTNAHATSTADRYIYCDFANIDEVEYDMDYEMEQEGLLRALDESTIMAAAQTSQLEHYGMNTLSADQLVRASGWVRSQRFPVKLYALLAQPQLSHIITWMPHGRSWKVLQPKLFETTILPVFFESDNYHSFIRVINAWSFRRKSSGPDRGSYFHELFLRGKPHLQKYMRRLPRTHKKIAMAKDEEPDFFELEATSPLPTVEESRHQINSRKMQGLHGHYDEGTLPKRTVAKNEQSSMEEAKLEAMSGVARSFLPPARASESGREETSLGGVNGDGEKIAARGGVGQLGALPTQGLLAQYPLSGQGDLLEQERYRLIMEEQALYQRQLSMMHGLPYGAMNPMGPSGLHPYFHGPP